VGLPYCCYSLSYSCCYRFEDKSKSSEKKIYKSVSPPNLSSSLLSSRISTGWTLTVIVWIAYFLRTNQLAGQSLWRDEVDAIRFSDWPVEDLVTGLIQKGHNGPLFFLLLRFWRNMFGDTEFALRYISVLMGTLAVPVGFVLARQLGLSRRAGLLLALLLATSPYLVWYGQEAKMYAFLLLTVTLAFVAYLKALDGLGLRWWLVFVVATTLSFYLHILSPLMLLVYVAVALLRYGDLRRHWKAWLSSMACLTLPYLPLAVWQFSFLAEGTDRGHPFYPLRQEFYVLLQLYTSGLLSFVGLTAIILFVFLFLAGLFLHNRRTRFEKLTSAKRLILATWALLPPLVVYLISLRVPVFEDRYLIYISPAFYLIVVLGLLLVRQHSTKLAALALGLILAINLLGIWQQQRQPLKADFRAAGAYLSNYPSRPATIMVQMPYLRHTLNYYYDHNYDFVEGLWTNGGNSADSVGQEMSRRTAGLTNLWLVVSEEDTWDSRHLVRAWLDDHATLVDRASFMRVDVYHYELRPGSIESQKSKALLEPH
jgi:hypothetical protein